MPPSGQPAHVQSVHPYRKLGARRPDLTRPRLHLARYTAPELVAAVPAAVDYLSHVNQWPMYGNDQLGDCTAAAAGHIEEVWSTYGQGQTVTVLDTAIVGFYSACSGYQPGRPDTDQGAGLQECLSYWRATGLGGHQIAAYFSVDPTDHAMIRTALYLFGAVYLGVDLPRIAQAQLDSGLPWDVVGDDGGSDGGHCVHLGAASTTGNYVVTTWGQLQQITPAWWGRYVTEAWAPVSTEWVRNGLSPAGLDVATLNHDFAELTGQQGPFSPSVVPPPAPVPAPSPVPEPAPPPKPTLAHDPADVEFSLALRVWLGHRHRGASHALVRAGATWLTEKHL